MDYIFITSTQLDSQGAHYFKTGDTAVPMANSLQRKHAGIGTNTSAVSCSILTLIHRENVEGF